MQVCGDLESQEGTEEVEMATSGATLTMLDKAVLGGVSIEMKYKYKYKHKYKCKYKYKDHARQSSSGQGEHEA